MNFYYIGIIICIGIVIISLLVFLIAQTIKSCYEYINDGKNELVFGDFLIKNMSFIFWNKNNIGDAIGVSIVSALVGCLACAAWPLLILVGSGYLCLRSMRGAVRFKKTVNKALDKKSNINHNHK